MGYVSQVDGYIDGVITCVCCGREILEGMVCSKCKKEAMEDEKEDKNA